MPFERFAGGLTDFKFIALDAAVRIVLRARGIDLVGTEWLKPLGQGLHEFRVRHDATEITQMFDDTASEGAEEPNSRTVTDRRREKVLLRVFVHFHGNKVVLLLNGYDKGADPNERRQQRAIAEARQHLKQFKERKRRRPTSAPRSRNPRP